MSKEEIICENCGENTDSTIFLINRKTILQYKDGVLIDCSKKINHIYSDFLSSNKKLLKGKHL